MKSVSFSYIARGWSPSQLHSDLLSADRIYKQIYLQIFTPKKESQFRLSPNEFLSTVEGSQCTQRESKQSWGQHYKRYSEKSQGNSRGHGGNPCSTRRPRFIQLIQLILLILTTFDTGKNEIILKFSTELPKIQLLIFVIPFRVRQTDSNCHKLPFCRFCFMKILKYLIKFHTNNVIIVIK